MVFCSLIFIIFHDWGVQLSRFYQHKLTLRHYWQPVNCHKSIIKFLCCAKQDWKMLIFIKNSCLWLIFMKKKNKFLSKWQWKSLKISLINIMSTLTLHILMECKCSVKKEIKQKMNTNLFHLENQWIDHLLKYLIQCRYHLIDSHSRYTGKLNANAIEKTETKPQTSKYSQ